MTSARYSISSIFMIIVALSFAGCAGNYKAVKEGDLSQIKMQLQAAERSLGKLERGQSASRDLLFIAEQESLRRTIAAIKEQVNGPECPAPQDIETLCEAQATEQAAVPVNAGYSADGKLVVGQIENVYVEPPGRVYQARIDTGADTSSLDAREIQIFERDGEDWVKFKMPLPGRTDLVDVERQVSRFVLIVQSSSEESERRPVVKMRTVIGSVERLAEFTLADREQLEFPVLIGRNILKDTLIVDVSRSKSIPLPEEFRDSEAANEPVNEPVDE